MNVITHISLVSLLFLVLVLPGLAFAACGSSAPYVFINPVLFCSLAELVQAILKVIMMILLPVIAFFIVKAGFSFVWARGNPVALGKAKMNFFYVIIGTCFMLGAWVISNMIGATVMQITT